LLLDQMTLRSVGADRLAFALAHAERPDDAWPEQKHEQQRREQRTTGAEGDVAEDVKDAEFARELAQPIEHGRFPPSPLV
jgi:hypothetical protein